VTKSPCTRNVILTDNKELRYRHFWFYVSERDIDVWWSGRHFRGRCVISLTLCDFRAVLVSLHGIYKRGRVSQRHCMLHRTVFVSCLLESVMEINLLSPRSVIFLNKIIVSQIVKKCPEFCRTRRFVSVFTRVSHLSLSSARLIQSTPCCLNKCQLTQWKNCLVNFYPLTTEISIEIHVPYYLLMNYLSTCY
jgi:hypothetical protein